MFNKTAIQKILDLLPDNLKDFYPIYVGLIGFLVLFLAIIWQASVLFLNDLPIHIFSISQAQTDMAIILSMAWAVFVLLLLSVYSRIWWILIFILLCLPLWMLVRSFIDNWWWVSSITIILAIIVPLIVYWKGNSVRLLSWGLKFIWLVTILISILYFLYHFTSTTLVMKYAEYEDEIVRIDYMNDQWIVIVTDDMKAKKERKIINISDIKGIYIKK